MFSAVTSKYGKIFKENKFIERYLALFNNLKNNNNNNDNKNSKINNPKTWQQLYGIWTNC